ncbi:MAG: hypothetical protein H7A46_26535 [Verrucomicrobiales bacterium]|nr:hypothetical protein [Verrucomicrobiales bacterium]
MTCPHCQQSLRFGAILRYTLRRLVGGARRQAQVSCPKCHRDVPLSAKECPHCAKPMAFGDLVDDKLEPVRRKWEKFKDDAAMDPGRQRRIQWTYFFLSALILWMLVSYVASHRTEDWLWQLGLCTVYLAVIAFLTAIIAPGGVFARMARWGWRVKMGLVCNYFSLLMVLQLFIGTFWKRAVTLATLFAVTYIAFLILSNILAPMAEPFQKKGPTRHDPTAPQGRRARYD